MAKGAIFIGWGENPAGYRQKALKVFDESMQYWKRLQQKGEIESFEPVFLEAHGGDLSGFVLIKGDREKLNRLRMSPEYESMLARASVIVRNLGVVDAFVGEELQRRLVESAKQIAELD